MSEPTNPQKLNSPAAVAPELNSPVPSPCVSLCKMDVERRYCMGCMRTIPEIKAWSTADDDYKRAVWAELRLREQQLRFDEDGWEIEGRA
jgi:predicted Fe-S protein YdhL (DUF1289 family)